MAVAGVSIDVPAGVDYALNITEVESTVPSIVGFAVAGCCI